MIPTRAYIEAQALRTLKSVGKHGYTVREFLLDVSESHHGQVSSVFSDLHKEGAIACLKEQRSGYCVYVLPKYVGKRPRRPHASVMRLSRQDSLLSLAAELREAVQTSDEHPYGTVDAAADALLAEIDRQYSCSGTTRKW